MTDKIETANVDLDRLPWWIWDEMMSAIDKDFTLFYANSENRAKFERWRDAGGADKYKQYEVEATIYEMSLQESDI